MVTAGPSGLALWDSLAHCRFIFSDHHDMTTYSIDLIHSTPLITTMMINSDRIINIMIVIIMIIMIFSESGVMMSAKKLSLLPFLQTASTW